MKKIKDCVLDLGEPRWASGLEHLSLVRKVRGSNPALGILFQRRNLNLVAVNQTSRQKITNICEHYTALHRYIWELDPFHRYIYSCKLQAKWLAYLQQCRRPSGLSGLQGGYEERWREGLIQYIAIVKNYK